VQFTELKLIDPLLRAVRAEGYDTPTPIQEQAIPPVLSGRDLIGCAQTGTGKTAAFALPILQRLHANNSGGRRIRVLVLTPTRELAAQIGDSFSTYGRNLPFKHAVIFGGVGQSPQEAALRRGVDILVATPGRLLDLMQQRIIHLNTIEIFVLDEADRMLDMGFIHDVRRVISALPKQRQTLLFSATMPLEIQQLADSILINPVHVEVTPQATTVEKIDQHIFFVEHKDKRFLLEHLLRDRSAQRVLVFTRTKHGANKVVKQLGQAGIVADAIHGNKSQTARERALEDFRKGKVRILVATDIAARGLDVEGITHVVNYDLPNIPESYVHRIGRTARAGASGIAYSFCAEDERPYLRDIERTIRMTVPVVRDHPYFSPLGLPTAGRPHQSASRPQPAPGRQNPPRNGQSASSNGNNAPARKRRRRRSRANTGNRVDYPV
jgi:ATP-dependent RNA helicase RhlE